MYKIRELGKYLVEVYMEKKSVSATVLVIFLSIFFAVIGICFSMFEYKDKKNRNPDRDFKQVRGLGHLF